MRCAAHLQMCPLSRYPSPYCHQHLHRHTAQASHADLAAVAPTIPVSRPSFCRVPPGTRSIHRHKWHLCGWIERVPGGTRENDGLETGIVGATAARSAWTAFVLPELVPRDACQRANECQRAAVRACRVRGGACRGAVHTMRACCQTSYGHYCGRVSLLECGVCFNAIIAHLILSWSQPNLKSETSLICRLASLPHPRQYRAEICIRDSHCTSTWHSPETRTKLHPKYFQLDSIFCLYTCPPNLGILVANCLLCCHDHSRLHRGSV